MRLIAPQLALARGDTLAQNARNFALIAMAVNDAFNGFPSYPSNHASGSSASLEMMRRLYGEAGHNLTLDGPALPGVVLHYTAFHQILADVSDARVYGGIHFRFDQGAGERLGREVATFVEKNYLRPIRP